MRNRKGFTLIEMMVVIAIIAILTAVIIPVVGNSTLKARAAANAANLRSVQGAVTSKGLLEANSVERGKIYDATNGVLTGLDMDAPVAEECIDVAEGAQMRVSVDNTGSAKATYRGYDVEYFAYIAEHGEAPEGYAPSGENGFLNDIEDLTNRVNNMIANNPNLTDEQKENLQDAIDTLNGSMNEIMNEVGFNQTAADIATGIANGVIDRIEEVAGCTCCQAGTWTGHWADFFKVGDCDSCTHKSWEHQ